MRGSYIRKHHRAWLALRMFTFGLCLLSGCAFVPRTKLDRSREYNTDLQTRLDRATAQLALHEKEDSKLQDEIVRLETEVAGSQEVQGILEQRLDNMRRENSRLQSEVTGLVMNAAGSRPSTSGLINVSSTSYHGFSLPDELSRSLEEFAKRHPGATFNAAEKVCRFSSNSLFQDGGDELRPEGRAALKELAAILGAQPASSLNLLIVGHTAPASQVRLAKSDQFPTDWHLAAHQAIAVQQDLEENQVNAIRAGIVSYAGQQPLVDGTDETSQRQNARLEIFLVPPDPPAGE